MKARIAALAVLSSLVVMTGCTRNESSREITRSQPAEKPATTTDQQPGQIEQPGSAATPAPSVRDESSGLNQPGSMSDQGANQGSGTESSGSSSY